MSDHDIEVDRVLGRLFGRDMIFVGALILQVALSALLTPLLTRLMTTSAYGSAMTATALMQLINALLMFGLFIGVQRAYARAGESGARQVITAGLGLSVLGGVILYLTGRWWAPAVGFHSFSWPARYALMWAVAYDITAPAWYLLRARDRTVSVLVLTAMQSVVSQVLAVAFVLLHARAATAYLLGQVVGQFAAAALALLMVRPLAIRRADFAFIRSVLRFSLPLVPAAAAGFVVDASDRILVHADLGASAVGRYAVASNVGNFVMVALGAVGTVWVSRLAELKDEEVLKSVIGQSRNQLVGLAGSAAVIVAAVSPILLAAWSPPSFHPSHLQLVAAMTAAIAIPWSVNTVYQAALLNRERSQTVMLIAIGEATLNVGLNLVLIPIWGMDGSALASLLQALLFVPVYHVLLRSDRPAIDLRWLVQVALWLAICIGCVAIPPTGWPLVGRCVLAVIALGFGAWRLWILVRPSLSRGSGDSEERVPAVLES